jgi:hypothetical protein
MKREIIIIFSIIFIVSYSYTGENEYESLLKQVHISHPYYGNQIYGNPKINTYQSVDSSLLLIYQAKYGGDGEHSENLLKLFKFKNDSVMKLIDINIDFVSFIKESYYLKYIQGKSVFSLCHVCDGWDAALPEDIFFIPIIIDVELLKIIVDFTEKEKQDFLNRFNQQATKNIKQRSSSKNKEYQKYVEKIKSEIIKILK